MLFLLDDRKIRIRIHTADDRFWIRIQEAQKHTDPTDPDPQHWTKISKNLKQQRSWKTKAEANRRRAEQIKYLYNVAVVVLHC